MTNLDIEVKSVTSPEKPALISCEISELEQSQDDFTHANQFLLDPRQKLAWESYVNPTSKTFGNASQSAVAAGYAWAYANQITTKGWWLGKVRKSGFMNKAEAVLEQMLDMPTEEPALLRIKADTAKFILERLGKDNGYSRRSEITCKNGVAVMISDEKRAEANAAIMAYLERKS
jgi:hypothetical protein